MRIEVKLIVVKLAHLDSSPKFDLGVIFLNLFYNVASLFLERWAIYPSIAMCMVTLLILRSAQSLKCAHRVIKHGNNSIQYEGLFGRVSRTDSWLNPRGALPNVFLSEVIHADSMV
jgi:hypothetical protein